MISIIVKAIILFVLFFVLADIVLYIIVKHKEKKLVSNKMDSGVVVSSVGESVDASPDHEHEV